MKVRGHWLQRQPASVGCETLFVVNVPLERKIVYKPFTKQLKKLAVLKSTCKSSSILRYNLIVNLDQ